MGATEDIRDIFSILHDGTISAWTGDKSLLTLTIECEYLAERLDRSFDKFYVELSSIEKIELAPWTNPIDLPVNKKTEFADIFEAELEIISSNINDDGCTVIACSQHDIELDYCGGNVTISCQTIRIFDQNNNSLTIAQLGEVSKNYWDEQIQR